VGQSGQPSNRLGTGPPSVARLLGFGLRRASKKSSRVFCITRAYLQLDRTHQQVVASRKAPPAEEVLHILVLRGELDARGLKHRLGDCDLGRVSSLKDRDQLKVILRQSVPVRCVLRPSREIIQRTPFD